MKVVGDNRQLASCWPPMGTCASCGMESYRRLRAPCIAQGRRCNECGSDGHLARACKTRKTLHAEGNGGRAKQKKETPANRSGLPGGAGVHAQETSYVHREPRSCRNLSGHRGWTNKRQKTQHVGSSDNILVMSSSLVHTSPKTNYTPSKSSRSSSIEQDETTIEIPHLEGEMVSNRKTHTPDKQTQDSNPALTATETGSDVKPDTKVFHSNGVGALCIKWTTTLSEMSQNK
jgi:hypothetical protein